MREQRRTYKYDSLMAVMVPIFLALYGALEPLRLYLGFSGNVLEKVRVRGCAQWDSTWSVWRSARRRGARGLRKYVRVWSM